MTVMKKLTRPKYWSGREVPMYDLFGDVIFYLLYCKDGETTFYLKKYPEITKLAEDFFKREYETWELKNEYSFEMFLKIQLEFKGLYYEFKEYMSKFFGNN